MDEESDQTDSDNEDDGEHDDDTSLLGGPVLTLGDVAEGVASDETSVDGRHFDSLPRGMLEPLTIVIGIEAWCLD